MSLRAAIDAALYSKLNVASVTAAAPGGVYNGRASEGVQTAHVTYQFVADVPQHTGGGRVHEYVYLVAGVAREDNPERCVDAFVAADAVLHNKTLTLSSGAFMKCLLDQEVDLPGDDESGESWLRAGAYYRIWADEADS